MNSKQLILCFLLNLAVNALGVPEYVYEFGNAGLGPEIYNKRDWIGYFRYTTTVDIPVPTPATPISYVKVTVHAINPPKVDFDERTRTVSIKYSLLEVTRSDYVIYAEGYSVYGDEKSVRRG